MVNYHEVLKNLSARLVKAQQPIRILDALKWNNNLQDFFFKHHCKELPPVTPQYYQSIALRFNIEEKLQEFYAIEKDIKKQLGVNNNVGKIMDRMCQEYRTVVRMLQARGSKQFSELSKQLYGSASDAFYTEGPTLQDLALLLTQTLQSIHHCIKPNEADEKQFTSCEAVAILSERLQRYFKWPEDEAAITRVKLSDDIIADASAGAEHIKIRSKARFSMRDLKILEVHEGWVHLGTTLNGLHQPICTFLSKGPPSSTVTQEGLAIIMEVFTFASFPKRMQGLSDRITAIAMAEAGADFIQVFNFFITQGLLSTEECYNRTVRVFRGSLPNAAPFTKDLVYNKGFILIYNYIRLSLQQGRLEKIPLLFLGKTTLEDVHVLSDLVEEGIVVPPKYIPEPFSDLAALSSWMSYSLFLNQIDLKHLALKYKDIL